MEGTDATHADHIETIKQREYVGCTTEGSFLPAQLGLGLVNGKSHMYFVHLLDALYGYGYNSLVASTSNFYKFR